MKKISFILMLLFCSKISFAQQISIDRQVFGSTGNYIDAGTIKASSTVGETVTLTFSQTALIVTQGFEQPVSDSIRIDIFTGGVKDIEPDGIHISVYPNPTMDEVILDFKLDKSMDIGTDIYNATGQLMRKHLQTKIKNNQKQELSFRGFVSGNYFIVVRSADSKLVRGFKVQKIN